MPDEPHGATMTFGSFEVGTDDIIWTLRYPAKWGEADRRRFAERVERAVLALVTANGVAVVAVDRLPVVPLDVDEMFERINAKLRERGVLTKPLHERTSGDDDGTVGG